MKSVAVFGAGIAGLSAAHEFARLGYRVSVYEANAEAGGFFRSARVPNDGGMPSEYSWHGMGPWYHNAFDVMKQIPFDATGSVFDKALSRPIDFGTAPDKGRAEFDHSHVLQVSKMLRMSGDDVCFAVGLPHFLDVLLAGLAGALVLLLLLVLRQTIP